MIKGVSAIIRLNVGFNVLDIIDPTYIHFLGSNSGGGGGTVVTPPPSAKVGQFDFSDPDQSGETVVIGL